ncbi:MAG TPA: glycosyltransferase family 2 protein [Candidatus Nanoarchaeia archaeon]|nr:glycosyltransferase family 2 protein [Candidatus Nanoarchaeia archaeon]
MEIPMLLEEASCPRKTEVIIAALNEEEGIGLTITELLRNLNARIVVVDGHSRDRTVEVAKDLGADVHFQDGRGKGNAIANALKHLDPDVDYVVLTDADYTYPAEYLPEMISILDENPNVGMVCGNRFGEKLDNKALRSRFYLGNRLLAFAHGFLNGVPLEDPLTGLRVIRADIIRGWAAKSNGFDIEVELNALIERSGFEMIETPILYRERLGKKKLQVKHGITILRRIVREAFAS